MKCVPVLLAFVFFGKPFWQALTAQPPFRPFDCGMAVVSCFSGLQSLPPNPTINVNGPVMGIIDVRAHALAPPGQWWQQASSTLKYMHPSWTAANMGQIFGLAIDSAGNIYATPTTVYYCPTSSHPSPFGPAGPGGVYRASGTTGLLSTYVTTGNFSPGGNSIPNKGSGLGNICYDPDHDQLFVTNFADGMIYRIKNGQVLSRFDPFSSTNSPQIGSPAFVTLGERTWGVGYYNNRVYFSRWQEDNGRPSNSVSNEIWSIGLSPSGDFAGVNFSGGTWENGEVLEIVLPCFAQNAQTPQGWSNPVSDIAFAQDGRMLLAERTMIGDCGGVLVGQPHLYAHSSRVLEYIKTGSTWVLTPGHGPSLCPTTNPASMKFRVGGYTVEANSAGGVDYGYDNFFPPNPPAQCDKFVWATGDQLLPHISTGQWVYGMQGMPATGGSYPTSALIDFDHDVTSHDKVQIGDVEIRKCPPCPEEPVFPCDSLKVSKRPAVFLPGTPPDSCCWDITLNLSAGPVVYVEAQLLTPGVTFGNVSVSPPFSLSTPTATSLIIFGLPKGIPPGVYPNAIRFCLKNITSPAQVPQMVVFNWYVAGPTDIPFLACKDTCYFDCKPPVPDPPGCLAVKWDSLVCNPNNPLEYTYYFQVQNLSSFTAQQVVLSNLPPGFGFKPCPPPPITSTSSSIVLPSSPLAVPPGGTFPLMCVQLVGTTAITSPTSLCFDAGIFAKDSCCHRKHCITLKPCCSPCERRRVVLQPSQPKDSCCHKLDIFNGCNFPYFTKLELVSLTPGVVFGSHATGGPSASQWVNPISTPTLVQWQHLSGFVPFGFFPGLIQFCLDSIKSPAQVPQIVVLRWITTSSTGKDSVACSDTLRLDCKPVVKQSCLKILKTSIKCVKDSATAQVYYLLQVTVQNTSTPPNTATHVILTPTTTPAPLISPNPISVGALPPNGVTTVTTGLYWTSPPPVGSLVCFQTRLADLLSGSNWCCFNYDSFCVKIPPCCCVDIEDLCADFDQATSLLIDSANCKVTLKLDTLKCPGYIEWVNWGDGNQTYGPFPPGSMPMHTYQTGGVYIISYLAIQLNDDGTICLEKILSDTLRLNCSTCKCGQYQGMYVNWKKKSNLPLQCNNPQPTLLPCPPAGGSYFIGGSFQCVGANCAGPVSVQWKWVRLPNITVATGSVVANPFFGVSITAPWYATPGTYELQLSAVCGKDTCRCTLRFRVDCPACPCNLQVIQQLAQAVNAGFAVMYYPGCKACFSPVALSSCESVEWFLGPLPGGTFLGTTWGNQPFCYTFPGSGTYIISMKVTRLKPDGTLCEVFIKQQTVKVVCPPLVAVEACPETVFGNPGFRVNSVAGALGTTGATAGWTSAQDAPTLVQNVPGSTDGWAIRLQGNATVADAFTAMTQECVRNDTGIIRLRWREEALSGSLLPGTEIVLAFHEKDLNSDAGVLKIRLPQLADWCDVEIPYDLNAWPLSVCSGPLGAKVVKPAVGICHPAPVDLAASASVLVDFFCFPSRKIVSTSDGLRSGDLRVYPVPTSGLLQVVVPDYTIGAPLSWRVCDPLGRTAQMGILADPFIDLSTLPAGFYLLYIEGANNQWVKPVVKQ